MTGAAVGSFSDFLDGVRQGALAEGLGQGAIDRVLRLTGPSAKVIQLDRYQPEFT